MNERNLKPFLKDFGFWSKTLVLIQIIYFAKFSHMIRTKREFELLCHVLLGTGEVKVMDLMLFSFKVHFL